MAAAEIDGLDTADAFIASNASYQKGIHSQKSAHMCRLIVSNESKSKGIGSAFLHELCKTCFFEMGLSRLTLRVFCFNIGALRCYEKCGFLATSYAVSYTHLDVYKRQSFTSRAIATIASSPGRESRARAWPAEREPSSKMCIRDRQ